MSIFVVPRNVVRRFVKQGVTLLFDAARMLVGGQQRDTGELPHPTYIRN